MDITIREWTFNVGNFLGAITSLLLLFGNGNAGYKAVQSHKGRSGQNSLPPLPTSRVKMKLCKHCRWKSSIARPKLVVKIVTLISKIHLAYYTKCHCVLNMLA